MEVGIDLKAVRGFFSYLINDVDFSLFALHFMCFARFCNIREEYAKKPSLLQIEAMIAGNANAHHPFSICATNRFAADAMRGTKYKKTL